jgi:hypothetical protein
MFIMPRVVAPKKRVSRRPKDVVSCNCSEPCTGYDSRAHCPPLIVLAVLAAVECGALALSGCSPA